MIGASRQSGLTLVEVLVAAALLAVMLIPAINALQSGIVGAEVHSDVTVNHYRIKARLEELLAEPFADLSNAAIAAGGPAVATSYSETAGLPNRIVVFLSFFDGDNADGDGDPFTGTESDLMWIRVDIEGSVHSLQTVRARGY